jgi:hypothetical protein
MSQNEPSETTAPSAPARQSVETRLDLKLPHLPRTRYRLLNLSECVKRNEPEEAAAAE